MNCEQTFGSLFSGIGGIDLGLEMAGFSCKWQVEIDPFCRSVLAKHWPDVKRYEDVRSFSPTREHKVDLICGGYPCQPFSIAGKRQGGEDERHLWPEFLRVIRILRPRYALLENVTGHLSLGFGRVLGDLAESGYDAEWDCFPAAAFGAHHKRDRVFILAYPNSPRCKKQWRPFSDEEKYSAAERESRWPPEPDVGRVAHGVPNRVDRIRGLGNAVVPQVVAAIAMNLSRAGYP